jgi:hypothetical protein
VKVTPGAAYLNVVRQFLKDNGIDNPHVGEELDKLEGLPRPAVHEHRRVRDHPK